MMSAFRTYAAGALLSSSGPSLPLRDAAEWLNEFSATETTFLERALQKCKSLGHTRGVKVWERVLGKARLFKEALQRGPVKPADIHLYHL